MKRKASLLISIFGLSVLTGLCAKQFTLPMGFGDSERYLAMAQDPVRFIGAPWGYRVAVPYAAQAISAGLSLPIETTFSALQLTMFAVILTGIVAWVSNQYKGGSLVGALCAILFAFSYPGVYNLHNVVHVGFAEHLCVLLGCMAIYGNRFGLLCILIALSCLGKESVGFLLIPTYFSYAATAFPWPIALRRGTLLIVAFLAPFCLLRFSNLFHHHGDSTTYASFYTLEYARFCWNYWGGPLGAAKQIASWFGPLYLLFAAGFLAAPTQLRALALLPILATFQILLATDVMRMVGVGVPVIVLVSSCALARMRIEYAVLLVIVCVGNFFSLNYNVGGNIARGIACVSTLAVLWINRSALLQPSLRS
jgi:hypothetical protein